MDRLTTSQLAVAGKITPPLADGLPRPAHYEFDGKFYDMHGAFIDPEGGEEAEASPPAEAELDVAALTPSELLAQAAEIPWAQFRTRAKEILGRTCPNGKVAITAALTKAIAEHARRTKARGNTPNPQRQRIAAPTTGKPTQTPAAKPKAAPAPKEADTAKATGPDLKAWGTGKADYLFAEVRKAIKAEYHKVVTTTRDAVDTLIEQKVITAKEARKDDD